MRTLRAVLCVSVLPVLAGCSPVGSIHSLYQPGEAPYLVPSLVGTWHREGGKSQEKWVIKKSEVPGWYEIDVTGPPGDGVGPITYNTMVRPVKVGDLIFFDAFMPSGASKDQNAPPQEDTPFAYIVELHSFQRVWIEPDRLRIAQLNPDWWQQQKQQKTLPVRVEEITDAEEGYRDVIVSSTDDLRAFVTQAAADPKAFSPEIVLVRAKPVPPAKPKAAPPAEPKRRGGR